MSLRTSFVMNCGPGAFSGITMSDWLRVLAENRFLVHPRYWPRAANITVSSVINSLLCGYEELRFGQRIRQAQVQPPIFVLGVRRSGTTHLHNLLAQDERFCYPNAYHVLYPHSFLGTEKILSKYIAAAMPETRPQDNVRYGVNTPQEDEVAQCSLTGYSSLLGFVFPRTLRYSRFMTFRDVPQRVIHRWQAAMLKFVQKLSYKYDGRPVVLKSPGHMGRIRLLLEVFPDARFVHIHRHPYVVQQSALHTVPKLRQWWALQRYQRPDLGGMLLDQYRTLCESYFTEQSLIDPSRFHEVAYGDLERDPIGQMREIYERLDLPEFSDVEGKLRGYLGTVADYRKNKLPDLPPALAERLVRECRQCYDAWGYEAELAPRREVA